jgi:hypothetical protein
MPLVEPSNATPADRSKMRSGFSASFFGSVLILLASAHSAHAKESRYIAQGYWASTENPDAFFARYLRITGDSGYSCHLDGKSGFAFAIVKDSITTPMNGMNAIQWMPNSGDIVITGSEKGVPYSDRFEPFDSAAYWGECAGQDKALHPTGLYGNEGRLRADGKTEAREFSPWLRAGFSLLGRKTETRSSQGRLTGP